MRRRKQPTYSAVQWPFVIARNIAIIMAPIVFYAAIIYFAVKAVIK